MSRLDKIKGDPSPRRGHPLSSLTIRVRWAYEYAVFQGEIRSENGSGWMVRAPSIEELKASARSSFPNTFLIYTYDDSALAHIKFQEVINASI